MFACADMVHFFAHEFTGLCRSRFALSVIAAGPFKCTFFWHVTSIGVTKPPLNGV